MPVSWARSGIVVLRYANRCRLEVWFKCCDLRFVAAVLGSTWDPGAKMYDLLPLVLKSTWSPSVKMYDLLPVSWVRRGIPVIRCTIYCHCLGNDVGPSAKIYDVLPGSWVRDGVQGRKYTICCWLLGLEVSPNAKIYDFACRRPLTTRHPKRSIKMTCRGQ